MIYLDSAATTMEKPASVPSATAWAMTHMASPGRGGHGAGMRAADTLYALRETAAQLFDVPSPEQVVLTYNATIWPSTPWCGLAPQCLSPAMSTTPSPVLCAPGGTSTSEWPRPRCSTRQGCWLPLRRSCGGGWMW